MQQKSDVKKGDILADEVVDSVMEGVNGNDVYGLDVVLVDISNVWRCTSAQVCSIPYDKS